MVGRSDVRHLRNGFGRRVDDEWIPAYEPELNPVEQVLNYSKCSPFGNFISEDVDHLEDVVETCFENQSCQKNLLHSLIIVQS